MNKNPLISVIMPVYNGEKFIRAAIQSILEQTFSSFELIIINDASTDGTVNIINQFTDKRIKRIDNSSNLGNYASRNIGNKLAKGEFIAVMDADDLALPNRLDTQYNYLKKHKNVGLTGSFGYLIDQSDKELGILKKPTDHQHIRLFLLSNNCFIHSSMMYRTSLLKKFHISYREQFKYSADYDFAATCSKKIKITNIPELLVHYRIHENQITTEKRSEQIYFANQIRLKQLRAFKINPKHLEISLHHKMMNSLLEDETELHNAISWCNKILQANEKFKIYHHKKLYEFLDFIIANSLKR